jgi:hypothetical protein
LNIIITPTAIIQLKLTKFILKPQNPLFSYTNPCIFMPSVNADMLINQGTDKIEVKN